MGTWLMTHVPCNGSSSLLCVQNLHFLGLMIWAVLEGAGTISSIGRPKYWMNCGRRDELVDDSRVVPPKFKMEPVANANMETSSLSNTFFLRLTGSKLVFSCVLSVRFCNFWFRILKLRDGDRSLSGSVVQAVLATAAQRCLGEKTNSFCDSTSFGYLQIIWVNYNDLTTTSLEIMVSKGNHPQMALIQISELL